LSDSGNLFLGLLDKDKDVFPLSALSPERPQVPKFKLFFNHCQIISRFSVSAAFFNIPQKFYIEMHWQQ
jgi:hypothetical protein